MAIQSASRVGRRYRSGPSSVFSLGCAAARFRLGRCPYPPGSGRASGRTIRVRHGIGTSDEMTVDWRLGVEDDDLPRHTDTVPIQSHVRGAPGRQVE